jgi:3' exoribonuclease, RNase T-like
MRYWHDWEFLEDGVTIAPISVGIVAEDGRSYYAVFYSAPWDRIERHPWLIENVVPHLPQLAAGPGDGDFPSGRLGVDLDHPDVKSRYTIAAEVRQFLTGARDRHPVELWGYYSSYDHIALCQLWGRMIDQPEGVPILTLDVQQEAIRLGLDGTLPRHTGDLHNALADALWTRDAWQYLVDHEGK